MNPCHFCNKPATIHYTSIVGKKKISQHLCEGCAREQGVVNGESPSQAGPALNLQALVSLIMSQQPRVSDHGALKCPECGLKYAQFRADGRLGCAHDYDAFMPALLPLLERVHREKLHVGKVPRSRQMRTEQDALLEALRVAIAAERYEDAARLRDRLRQKDNLG